MRRFEYQILQTNDVTEASLNALGNEGWELVCSIQSIVHGSCLLVKREKIPQEGKEAPD